jgi:L-seryl-tRNA(Ser) seleniumtransferase
MSRLAVVRAAAADIPSLDRLLNASAFAPLLDRYSRTQVTVALRRALAGLRERAIVDALDPGALRAESLAVQVEEQLQSETRPQLRPVFNLTGTVLHTNLGRAVLPPSVIQAVLQTLSAPLNLEFDLASGGRGDRDEVVEPILRELTGAESATIVNNNAAAVLLMLNTLAKGREVVVSRGELVEIGGGFRIPEVMRSAGAKLVEVGTTNRTHLSDYAAAVNPRTALLMKVHTSNYAITGYTAAVPLTELAMLGRERGVPVAMDLGSGALTDLGRFGLSSEPTVRDAVAAGADLLTFSGDKLLGGPQAGIVVGRGDLIGRLKKNPLKRALRVGKLTLVALEGVLRLYLAPEQLCERLTTLRWLTRQTSDIEQQAHRALGAVQAALGEGFLVTVEPMTSQIGSGALPSERLASAGLRVQKARLRGAGLNGLEAMLRALPRPVIGRVADKALWLDLRCLEVADEADFIAQWSRFGR